MTDPIEVFDGYWAMRDFYAERDPTFTVVTRSGREYTVTRSDITAYTTQDNFDFGETARIIRVGIPSRSDQPYGIEAEDEAVVFRERGFHRRSPDELASVPQQYGVERELVNTLAVSTDG